MNKKSILIPTLAGLLVSTIPYQKTQAAALNNALIAGATIIGAYTLTQWLREPSSHDLIRNAQTVNKNALFACTPLFNILESLYACTIQTCSSEQKQQIINDLSEHNLYAVAQSTFGTGRQTVHASINELNATLNLAQKQMHSLSTRLSTLSKKNQSNSDDFIAMEQIRNQLAQTSEQAGFLRNYLNHHASYFYLYELEQMLRTRYARELSLNTVYPVDQTRLQQELRISVMLRAQYQEHPGYLYQEYVRTLTNDIETLFTRITRLAFAYHERISECHALAATLTTLKHSIMADPEYARSIADYQAYLQQEARLAAQRARLAAEREHIRMEHERACLERERARIEREKMLQLEEQNRILREQNRIRERELCEPSAPPAYEEVIDDSGCYY